jgi:predicted secreted Zn-dependent protease
MMKLTRLIKRNWNVFVSGVKKRVENAKFWGGVIRAPGMARDAASST